MTQTRTREVEDTLTGTLGGIRKEVDKLVARGDLVWVAPPQQVTERVWESRLRFRVPVEPGREVATVRSHMPATRMPATAVARPWWRRRWPYVTAGITSAFALVLWAVLVVLDLLSTYGTVILGFLAALVLLPAAVKFGLYLTSDDCEITVFHRRR